MSDTPKCQHLNSFIHETYEIARCLNCGEMGPVGLKSGWIYWGARWTNKWDQQIGYAEMEKEPLESLRARMPLEIKKCLLG